MKLLSLGKYLLSLAVVLYFLIAGYGKLRTTMDEKRAAYRADPANQWTETVPNQTSYSAAEYIIDRRISVYEIKDEDTGCQYLMFEYTTDRMIYPRLDKTGHPVCHP